MQNAACRIVLHRGNRDSTDQMHTELGLIRSPDRREMHLSRLTHKNVHTSGSLSKFSHRVATGRIDRTRRCNEFNLIVPRVKTMKGSCAYSFRRPDKWNELKVDLKAITKYETFKSTIMKRTFPPFINHPT